MQHEGMQPFQETHPPLSFSILASCVLPVEQQSDGGDHTNMGFGQQITLEHNGWLARIKPLLRLSFYIIFTHTHTQKKCSSLPSTQPLRENYPLYEKPVGWISPDSHLSSSRMLNNHKP